MLVSSTCHWLTTVAGAPATKKAHVRPRTPSPPTPFPSPVSHAERTTCSAPIEFQSTDAAKAACPSGSLLGSGDASIELPGGLVYQGITVTTFNGPGRNQVRLHTYDPRLAGATPTVFGRIVKSNKGAKYGQALVVDDAPDVAGDAGRITSFNTSVEKKTGVALARCKAKKFIWNRIVTYDDGTKENVTLKQNCKRRRR